MGDKALRTVSWGTNALIGDEQPRLDGVDKASGYAKYTNDINPAGTLYAKLLTCTHAKAKVTRLNLDKAKAIPGVHTIYLFKDPSDDMKNQCEWDGELVAAVAAETADIAEDGVRAIEVSYEVQPHWVDEEDLAGARAKGVTKEGIVETTVGDPDAAIKAAHTVHEGYYGITTISHMCLEPHGSHSQWNTGDGPKLTVHHSTQAVSTTGPQFASNFGLDASDVRIICNYVGGGFGSKFAADIWGWASAQMSKDTGRPVRLMLDRATELKTPGTRPSGFSKVTVAADEDGVITAWKSEIWGTNGPKGGTVDGNQMPYVFDFPNKQIKVTGIATNCGPNRAWRAPPHPQLCALTDPAITDLAAKMDIDPLEMYLENVKKLDSRSDASKSDVYKAELERAAELMEWDDKYHAPGKGEGGVVKRGVGVAIHRWGGRAGNSSCNVKIHPDCGAEVFLGSQDLGTGTRTIIAMVLADSLGLPLDKVKVHIGSNAYPPANPSGGSITVGGVSGPVRRAALEALWTIFDKVGAKHGIEPTDLNAFGGRIWHDNNEVCSWKDACRLLEVVLETQSAGPKDDGLTSSGVAGVQMADVSVDTETGIVRMNRMVAVQDCGTIINPLTARSQVYGGLIMGIAYSLSEERIMDNKTGRYINADLENYKLPRIGDIGELIVEMYQPESEYTRGVVGLGEPPVISTGAAISNAVFNAIGVRVPVIPLTPKRVLDALKQA